MIAFATWQHTNFLQMQVIFRKTRGLIRKNCDFDSVESPGEISRMTLNFFSPKTILGALNG